MNRNLASTALVLASASLGFPVFVKPANLGSSVGISKAHDAAELETAFRTAEQYDQQLASEGH